MEQPQLIIKSFDELTNHELYQILQLRSSVFVVEQHCIYLDMDENDSIARHFFYSLNDKVISYLRVMPPLGINNEASIGRIVTEITHRKKGLVKSLMLNALSTIKKAYNSDIKMLAQSYLQAYYEQFGFVIVGDELLYEGIPHFHMVLKNTNNQ